MPRYGERFTDYVVRVLGLRRAAQVQATEAQAIERTGRGIEASRKRPGGDHELARSKRRTQHPGSDGA